MATGKDVADIAEQVVAARRRGLRDFQYGAVKFDLTESGMCARFVRECHEAAIGIREFAWPYAAGSGKEMAEELRRAGLLVANRQRGDVIALSGGQWGHIVIYLGDGMVAENTISGSRGNPRSPGTKITPLADVGTSRITGWYRPLPGDEHLAEDWARAAQAWVKEHHISDGLRPRDGATRQEVWVMLMETAAEITSR